MGCHFELTADTALQITLVALTWMLIALAPRRPAGRAFQTLASPDPAFGVCRRPAAVAFLRFSSRAVSSNGKSAPSI
jgi:hypothetical protein